MALHEGTTGSVKAGPSATAVAVGWLTEWEFNTSTDLNTSGPFIGDDNKYKTRSGKDGKGSLKGMTPAGRDAGQTALMDAQDNGVDIRLELVEDDGYTYTMQAIITEIKHGQKADEGVPFECSFECNGGWTRVATA